MNKKIIFAWACDYTKFSGEGNLARKFIKDLRFYKNKVVVKSYLKSNQKTLGFNDKYLSPLIGILNCWQFYFKGYSICYVNFLPLWNILIFFLLPPKTIIGPITGGAYYNSSIKYQYLIRKFLFPIFYRISEIIINLRKKKILFSTSLLKNSLSNNTIKKSIFDYAFSNLKIKKYKKKKLDFVIYYRKNKNKNSFFSENLLKKINKLGYDIHIVGDHLELNFVENHGFLNKHRLNKLLSEARFTIASGENIFSFFSIDCIQNNVIVFTDNLRNYDNKHFNHFFEKINFKNLKLELKKFKSKKMRKNNKKSISLKDFFWIF